MIVKSLDDFNVNCNIYKNSISKNKFILILTIIGIILYLPYLLSFYPGIFCYDASVQFDQVLGISPYNNAHPILHTLIIKFFYSIGYSIFKSRNIGILFFTIFQMIFVSFTFANVIYICYKNKINKVFIGLLFIFYYLVPYNALYSITLYKDVLFSCCLLLIVLFLYDHDDNYSIIDKIKFIILSVLVFLLRTNGIIVIILFTITLFILNKKNLKNVIKLLFISIFISMSFRFYIVKILNIQDVDFIGSSLSIPLQNISYVVSNDGNISKEEYKKLNMYIDVSQIKTLYDKDFSDPIVNLMNSKSDNKFKDDKITFYKLWFNIGIKNINMYIKSYAYQTSGYWFHNYATNTFPIYDNIDMTGVTHKNLNIKFINEILEILMYLNRAFQHIFWSNALSIYIILFSMFYSILKNKKIYHIYPIVILWLILLLVTPVGYEFRYQYAIFISFPFILLTTLIKDNIKFEEKN